MTDQFQRIAAHIALLPTPEQWAELRDRIAALEAAQASTQPTAPGPAGSLVERVANAVSSGVVDGDYTQVSRAAIREVAAWLEAKGQHGWSNWLREEADRG